MFEKLLRKLAREYKYQTLYSRAKELGTVKLFKNNLDFTGLQSRFLDWLEIYNSLYTDLAMHEKNIDEDVINDDLRAEAYLLWKREQRKKENKKGTTSKKKEKKKGSGDIPSIIFTHKKEVK